MSTTPLSPQTTAPRQQPTRATDREESMTSPMEHAPEMITSFDQRRKLAITRLKAKHDFFAHVIVYILVNAMLMVIWAFTYAGFFWPIFPIAGWGVGLLLNGYAVFFDNQFTDAQIQREMNKRP